MQLQHHNTHFSKKQFQLTVISDGIENAANIGSLFRCADAFGVQHLLLCGTHITLGRKIKKTSRATEKHVNYSTSNNALHELQQLKAQNYYVIGLEITTESKAIQHFEIPKQQPLALVIGNENFGICTSVLQLCDAILHINMYGHNSSMNVVQATSIALFEITKQLER